MDKYLKIERIDENLFIEYRLIRKINLKDTTLDAVLNDLSLRIESLEDV
jgi:hypothetical protein